MEAAPAYGGGNMGMGGYALPPALPAPSEWTSFDSGSRGALPDMFRQA